jgi:hypothetical protein
MNEPDGFDQQPQEISREQAFREAMAARNAIASESFGSGDSAVFGNKPSGEASQQAAKPSKREEMMEKLGGIIADAIGRQLAELPAAIAAAISGASHQPAAMATPAVAPVGGNQKGEPVVPTFLDSQQGGEAIRSEGKQAPSPSLGTYSVRTAPTPTVSDVRPRELAGYPMDMLPQTPLRIGRETPMRSLDEPPEVPAGVDPLSTASASPRPMAGPWTPPNEPRNTGTQSAYQVPQHVPPAYYSPAADPQGNPRVDVAGGQAGEMTELVREYSEANMSHHQAMRMFIGMVIESTRQLTEEIYQANAALDRQERAL